MQCLHLAKLADGRAASIQTGQDSLPDIAHANNVRATGSITVASRAAATLGTILDRPRQSRHPTKICANSPAASKLSANLPGASSGISSLF